MPNEIPSVAVNETTADNKRQFQIFIFIAAMMVLAAALIVWLQIRLPYQINGNEGWNAYHATFLRTGSPLYPSDITWTISNYPPVSFWMNALLSYVTGNVNLAGRLWNVCGLILLSIAAAWIVRERFGRQWGILCGCFTCLYFAVVLRGYVAVNDPQLIGLGLALVGLCCSIFPPQAGSTTLAGAVLIVAACGIKHNLVSILFVTFAFLWLARKSQAKSWTIQVFAVSILGLALCQVLYGQAFWLNLFSKRGYSLDSAKELFRILLSTAPGPLVLAVVYVFCRPFPLHKDFIAMGIATGLALGAGFSGGSVALNVYYELIFFSLVASYTVLGHLRQTLSQNGQLTVFLPLALLLTAVPQLLNYAGQVRTFPHLSQEAADQVSYLKSIQGPAICDNLLLCHESEKPLEIDLFWLVESIRVNRIPVERFNEVLRSGKFEVIELDLPPSVDPAQPFEHYRFPKESVDTLLRHYEAKKTWPFRVFFVRRPVQP